MTAFIFTDDGHDFLIAKSRSLRKNGTLNDVVNSAAVAKYSYGKPLPNGETADTPPGGYSGCQTQCGTTAERHGWASKIGKSDTSDNLELLEARVSGNGMVAVVYQNLAANQVIVGFKGSAAAESGYGLKGFTNDQYAQGQLDWRNNERQLEIFSSLINDSELPKQYLDSAQFLKETMAKFPNQKILVTGHSKGGGQAQYAMLANMDEIERRNENPAASIKGYGFNPSPLARSIDGLVAQGHDRTKMRRFANQNIELFQLSNTDGLREAIAETLASPTGINAAPPSTEWFGKMNHLFVPKTAKCSSRDLHGMELTRQAIVREGAMPDDFIYKGRKAFDWRDTRGTTFYKYQTSEATPFEQPLQAEASCTNKSISLFSETTTPPPNLAEWRGKRDHAPTTATAPQLSMK